jgi:hypothetical protein
MTMARTARILAAVATAPTAIGRRWEQQQQGWQWQGLVYSKVGQFLSSHIKYADILFLITTTQINYRGG